MQVFTAFGHAQVGMAVNLFEWIKELDERLVGHTCLLITDRTMSGQEAAPVLSVAQDIFDKVDIIRPNVQTPKGWPFAQNLMFQTAASWAHAFGKNPFLWLETDAIPTKPGWLRELEFEFVRSKRGYMGVYFEKPRPHLTGTAIWSGKTKSDSIARDVYCAGRNPFDSMVRPNAGIHVTHQIQHNWDLLPFTEEDHLKQIRSGVTLFHRNKDHNLIKLLREQRNGGPAPVTVKQIERAPEPEPPPTMPPAPPLPPTAPPIPVESRPVGAADCVVQLCRYGDIINILPIAHEVFRRTKKKLSFVVGKKFASVLDGVTYVNRVVWSGSSNEPALAGGAMKNRFDNVFCAQLHGHGCPKPRGDTESFAREQWMQLGWGDQWGKLPVVFDKRSKAREGLLLKGIQKTTLKKVGLSWAGKSGKFDSGEAGTITERLKAAFPDVQFVNFEPIKAIKVFDLLGVIETLDCLVTIDTLHLHLSRALNVPVIALIRDGWVGAHSIKENVVLEVDYSEATDRTEDIVTAVGDALDMGDAQGSPGTGDPKLLALTIVHNGALFLMHHLATLNRLNRPFQWVIVEGSATAVKDTDWCKTQSPGHSTDGTMELLSDLKRHKNITVLSREEWAGKTQMVNAGLEEIREDGVLLQLDCDEMWTDTQLEAILDMFDADPEKHSALFMCRYFVGTHMYVDKEDGWGNQGFEWLRAWRFRAGMKFKTHEPPKLHPLPAGVFSKSETAALGLVFDHYAYALESQVEFKERYYQYPDAVEQWKKMQSSRAGRKLGSFLDWVPDDNPAKLKRV